MHWILLASIVVAPSAAGNAGAACTAAHDVAARNWIGRAEHAVGVTRAAGRVLHFKSMDGDVQDYQSDRTYPPFFSAFFGRETWLDVGTGAERVASSQIFPTYEGRAPTTLATERSTVMVGDTAIVPAPLMHLQTLVVRALNPWAVLHDWSADPAVRSEGRCEYRDYERVVLERHGPFGDERLFIDPKTAVPVKLDRTEPHYLWGQVHVEYVYSTWLLADGVKYPGAAFQVVDGETKVSSSITSFGLVPPDSAPALTLPAATPAMTPEFPAFLQAAAPDTIRVAPSTVLLRNRGYTEAVTLARDTVFVMDATQGDDRARQDSALIGKLFPGRHPIVVVVTDLALPHIAGVRFWVASGATIVSHRASRAFLERVIARRWTRSPDKLERERAHARLRFRAVSDSLVLAAGAVKVYPIDGIASEGALMAWVPGARFLWASDYVQTAQEPSEYALEVWHATRRVGIAPTVVAAEHLPPTQWTVIDGMVGGVDATDP